MRDGGVEVVGIVIQRGVPEWSFVSYVGEETEGENVRMFAGHGVHGMTSKRAVQYRSSLTARTLAFLYRIVGVSCSSGVSGEEHSFGNTVVESDEGMFPVADVVPEADVQDCGPEVVGVEVEPEGVQYAMPFVDEDEDCGGGGAA